MRRRAREGFTLLELLVAISIIGLLAMMVTPHAMRQFSSAKIRATRIEIKSYESALELFKLDAGRFPTQQEGLAALVWRPNALAEWRGPYISKNATLHDPWGNPYIYTVPGKNDAYDIVSLGADGKEGGNDENEDITSAR